MALLSLLSKPCKFDVGLCHSLLQFISFRQFTNKKSFCILNEPTQSDVKLWEIVFFVWNDCFVGFV